MKIVDRKTFLAMPEGTVYCKIQFRDPTPEEHAYSNNSGWDASFGIEDPSIKGETCSSDDFYTCGIGDFQAKEGDPMAVLQDICDHPGKEVPFEMAGGRDGLYDDTHVYFAIYSRDEVQEMIDELQKSLSQAYDKTERHPLTADEKGAMMQEVIDKFDWQRAFAYNVLEGKDFKTIQDMKDKAARLLLMCLEHTDREFWWAGAHGLFASVDDRWGLSLRYCPMWKRERYPWQKMQGSLAEALDSKVTDVFKPEKQE